MLFRHQEEEEINLYAENIRSLEIKKEFVSKGGSKAMYELDPVSDIKVCNHNGRYSIEVQIKSSFNDQTESWIIVHGMTSLSEKPCRSKRKGKLRRKPAAKARPTLKPSSISDVNSIPIGQ